MTSTEQSATVIPCLRYADAPAAIAWLTEAFGFEAQLVVDAPGARIAHAQLTYAGGMVMLGSDGDADGSALHWPTGAASVYVVVPDADAHFERAAAAGATVVRPPEDADYGGRGYTVRDPEGNLWSFGTYRP